MNKKGSRKTSLTKKARTTQQGRRTKKDGAEGVEQK